MRGHIQRSIALAAAPAPRWVKRITSRLRALAADDGTRAAVTPHANNAHVDDDDPVDEAGAESFPASDPPPWTLGVEPRTLKP